MKTQLVSILLFAAPLMLHLMVSENAPLAEPPAAKSTAPATGKTSSGRADAATAAKPTTAKPAAPAGKGSRIPAKLAPWFM